MLQGIAWQGQRASLCIHGQDDKAELIHYVIGDSASTPLVGPHSTRALPGRGTNHVHDPRAEPWRSDISERSCGRRRD